MRMILAIDSIVYSYGYPSSHDIISLIAEKSAEMKVREEVVLRSKEDTISKAKHRNVTALSEKLTWERYKI